MLQFFFGLEIEKKKIPLSRTEAEYWMSSGLCLEFRSHAPPCLVVISTGSIGDPNIEILNINKLFHDAHHYLRIPKSKKL
jgi:hypothetical protein